MFLVIAAAVTTTYYLGWVPPAYAVPLLFACSFLAMEVPQSPDGPGPYRPPRGSRKHTASRSENPGTGGPAETSTACSTGGQLQAAPDGPSKQAELSKPTERGGSGSGHSDVSGTDGCRGPTPPEPAGYGDTLAATWYEYELPPDNGSGS
jgi:hypothetical protein